MSTPTKARISTTADEKFLHMVDAVTSHKVKTNDEIGTQQEQQENDCILAMQEIAVANLVGFLMMAVFKRRAQHRQTNEEHETARCAIESVTIKLCQAFYSANQTALAEAVAEAKVEWEHLHR